MNMAHLVPETFTKQFRESQGSKVEPWILQLPDLIARCAERFDIHCEAPYDNLSLNLLLKALRPDGTPVVLKLSFFRDELIHELNALRDYAGHGVIGLVDADEELGAYIMVAAAPGMPLSVIDDDQAATVVFSEVFTRLHGAVPRHAYPDLNTHYRALHRYREQFRDVAGPLPVEWVARASQELEDLVTTTTDFALLHGDLHHENILRHRDGWVVIDPKGHIGDPHFDVIQFLLNYEDRGGDPDTVLRRRIPIICERCGLDRERIARWGVTRGVLEACWAWEDGNDWRPGIGITERFARLLD